MVVFDIPFIPDAYQPYIIGGLVILVGLKILSSILAPARDDSDLYVLKRCSCGWAGRVSKHSPVCRQCGAKIAL